MAILSLPPAASAAALPRGAGVRLAEATTLPLARWDNAGGEQHSVALALGTPPQRLDVVVDTGSPDLWVLGACADAAECEGVPLFGGASAVRSGREFSAEYDGGSAAGEVVTDAVGLPGGTVGSFGVVNATSEWKAANTTLSGLLGLGLPYAADDEPPLWLQAAAQWPEPLFGVRLGRRADTPGAITFGGIDKTSITGETTYLPLLSLHDWAVALDSVVVSGRVVAAGAASVDTGSSHILAPRAAFDAFYAAIPGAFMHAAVPLFPCGTRLGVSFTLGGRAFPVQDADLAIASYVPVELAALGVSLPADANTELWCEGAVRLNDGDDWILGDAFLKNVYSVFRAHPPSVGFAQLAPALGDFMPWAFGTGPTRWPPPLAAATQRATILALVALLAVLSLAARLISRRTRRGRVRLHSHKHSA